jgi:hypothetical protein
MWTVANVSQSIAQGQVDISPWGANLALASFAASMTVNALVTGLIVFRIFKVFREVKDVTGGRKLRSIIFIIIESGMALFAIQLLRLVVGATGQSTTAEVDIYNLIIGIHEMVNVVI